jgi:hypothetical protein
MVPTTLDDLREGQRGVAQSPRFVALAALNRHRARLMHPALNKPSFFARSHEKNQVSGRFAGFGLLKFSLN